MPAVDVTVEGAPAAAPAFGPLDASTLVERAARAVLAERGVHDGEISVALMDDPAMAAMNRQWKGRDATTDVLAFSLHDEGDPPLGDVYIGWEQALRQAAEMDEPPARELARLAIHGTLHVLGFDHPEQGREESPMWKLQERILEELGIA
ncbi:MAG: rRNA maturation RNase YbeY [Gemmatimonadetes bacterium]|nr:rRNA maturation RNase YbeY [Gemmatimonadota bacterium]